MSAAPFICLFIIWLMFSWHKEQHQKLSWQQRVCIKGVNWHTCMYTCSYCVYVCVCSLTLWCQPLRSLPALARHDPSVTFLLPSLLPSLPHPLHSVHPSLCVSILLFHPFCFSICLHPSISACLCHPQSALILSPALFLLLSPLFPANCLFFFFPLKKFIVSSLISLSLLIFQISLFLSASAFVRLQTTRLKLMKTKTCGHSSLCNNNNSHHQMITRSSPRAFFHCSPSFLRPSWDPAGPCRALRPSVTAPCWTNLG